MAKKSMMDMPMKKSAMKGPSMMKSKAHPGFKAVQSKIAQKYGMKRAGAILAAAGRKASPAAKAANPRLLKIRGAKRGK